MSASPLVSIVVCFFDAIEITARCIDRIRRCTSGVSYELILVDDGSEDPGAEGLGDLPRLRFIRSKHNMGFTGAANLGARHAVGDDLVFLNNDTEVEPGWLEALLDVARSGPDVGAVGAMLIGPDGLLQEAGGVIWSDATGLNYGRGRDPREPEFRYRREVDYCSGACLLVDAALRSGWWIRRVLRSRLLRGHRPVFHLAMKGHVVLYEPQARAVDLEGAMFALKDSRCI